MVNWLLRTPYFVCCGHEDSASSWLDVALEGMKYCGLTPQGPGKEDLKSTAVPTFQLVVSLCGCLSPPSSSIV